MADNIIATQNIQPVSLTAAPEPLRYEQEKPTRIAHFEDPAAVEAIQKMVGATPDGMFGRNTRDALQRSVENYQRLGGLPVTGALDGKVLAMIKQEHPEAGAALEKMSEKNVHGHSELDSLYHPRAEEGAPRALAAGPAATPAGGVVPVVDHEGPKGRAQAGADINTPEIPRYTGPAEGHPVLVIPSLTQGNSTLEIPGNKAAPAGPSAPLPGLLYAQGAFDQYKQDGSIHGPELKPAYDLAVTHVGPQSLEVMARQQPAATPVTMSQNLALSAPKMA